MLIGLTGGLAAPLVAAGVSAVLGLLGIGGSLLGLLATGLALGLSNYGDFLNSIPRHC